MTTTAVQPQLFLNEGEQPWIALDFTIEANEAEPGSKSYFLTRRYICEPTDERVEIDNFMDASAVIGRIVDRLISVKGKVSKILYELTGDNYKGDHITLTEWEALFMNIRSSFGGELGSELDTLWARRNMLIPVETIAAMDKILSVFISRYLDILSIVGRDLTIPTGTYHRIYRQELHKALKDI